MQVEWLWRRGRSTYARILFMLARYAALASVVVGLLPVRSTTLIGFRHQARLT